jgi:hypothetical protein
MERKIVVVLVVGDDHVEAWEVPFRMGSPLVDQVRMREVMQSITDCEAERLEREKRNALRRRADGHTTV